MVIFFHYKILMGGGGTLIGRMAKWFRSRKEKFILVTKGFSGSSEKNMKKLYEDLDVIIEVVSDMNLYIMKRIIEEHIKKEEKLYFFSFDTSFEFFLLAKNIERKMGLVNVKNTIYVINPIPSKKKLSCINKMEKAYCKFIEQKLFVSLYNNYNIIYMDHYSLGDAKKYYGIELQENHVFRLPIYLNDFDIKTVRDRRLRSRFNILTIARADFPFKGYIIGLIDAFLKLKTCYDNVTLTIISYGRDEKKITDKVDQLSLREKQSIILVGQVEYSQLEKYFSQANLFVGMGTTLLDAANYSVPGIIVHCYTYNAIATGFFCDYPQILGSSNNKLELIDLMEEVINMSDDEYENLSRRTYEALESTYNIEKIMPNLLTFIEKQKNVEVGCYLQVSVSLRKLKKFFRMLKSRIYNGLIFR